MAPVAMAMKFETKSANSACIRNIPEIFAYNRAFSRSGYRIISVKF